MNAAAHGATIDTTGAGGPLVLTADMQASSTGARTLVIQGDNAATNEVQGKIVDGSGTTTLWKYGLGTWKLSGASTFSGGSLLRYGAVILGNKSALGSGMVEIRGVSISASTDLSGPNAVANNVSLDTDTPTFTGTNSIEFSGVVTNALSVQVITDNLSAGNLVFSGNLYLSDVNTGFRAVTITGPGAAIVSGNIANNSGGNTNPCTLTYSGSGRLTLSGSNTYCGVTTVSSGILLLNSPNALPGGSGSTGGSAWLKISGGVVGLGNGDFLRALGSATNQAQFYSPGGGFAAYGADRAVNLGGVSAGVTWNTGGFVSTSNALVLGAASADHTVDFQNPIALATAVRTVQVDDGSAAVDARLSGALTGTGISGLTKTGLGTLELTATNNYAGATTVAAGRLLVDGVTSGQSNYVVNAGGTLGGTGTVGLASGRTVTVGAGGTLAPGVNGVGTLNLNGGLVFGENACYAWEYKDGSGDRVSVSGALQLPSVATVTVTQISGALPTPAVLFSAGSLTGASDLSGWVITGSYTAKIGSTNVILIAHHPGTVIGVR